MPAARSWDYQALLIQEALGAHAGTKPGSAEAQRQMGQAALATREAASNASAPGRARIAVDPILYPVRRTAEACLGMHRLCQRPSNAKSVLHRCRQGNAMCDNQH